MELKKKKLEVAKQKYNQEEEKLNPLKNDIESIFVLADICINQYPEKMIGHYFNGIGHELINENNRSTLYKFYW